MAAGATDPRRALPDALVRLPGDFELTEEALSGASLANFAREVRGLTTDKVTREFLTRPATVAQRTVCLVFNEGYSASGRPSPARRSGL